MCWCRYRRQVPEGSGEFRCVLVCAGGSGEFRCVLVCAGGSGEFRRVLV